MDEMYQQGRRHYWLCVAIQFGLYAIPALATLLFDGQLVITETLLMQMTLTASMLAVNRFAIMRWVTGAAFGFKALLEIITCVFITYIVLFDPNPVGLQGFWKWFAVAVLYAQTLFYVYAAAAFLMFDSVRLFLLPVDRRAAFYEERYGQWENVYADT